MNSARDLASLEQKLGYQFQDKQLLRHALTHGSAIEARNPLNSYQRLEFLGDRVLGLAMAAILFQKFPQNLEGELSRRLTSLVRKESCAEIGKELALGQYLILGTGEVQNGGREKPTILADVIEAILGAIFIEAGFEVVKTCIANLWEEQINGSGLAKRDYKTALQEWAHSQNFENPSYTQVSRKGPDHNPVFIIEVRINDDLKACGKGSSKRIAQQEAARTLKAIVAEREMKASHTSS